MRPRFSDPQMGEPWELAEGELRWAAASFGERRLRWLIPLVRAALRYARERAAHVRSAEHYAEGDTGFCRCGWGAAKRAGGHA